MLSTLLISCHSWPEDIPYGKAECAFCRMSVVDRQHGAEMVTDKGKVYFFDAIECMANFHQAQEEKTFRHLLVTDFNTPGRLIPAEEATYLISKQLPSPMGAFLSAFEDHEDLQQALVRYEGRAYTWSAILEMARLHKFGVFDDE